MQTQPILTKFYAQVKRSNPNFTEYSLRRTVEVIINEVEDLGFMNRVSNTDIDAVLDLVDRDKISVRETEV